MFDFLKQMVSNKVAVSDEQLHRDVYSAQDLLLQEANKILGEPSKFSEDRLDTLKKLDSLGFSNTKEVTEFRELEKERRQSERLKGLIQKYQSKYPNNKFINQDAVQAICQKYNLFLCGASDYISDIPEKNQKEIVNFKFNEVDYRTPDEMYSFGSLMRDYYIDLSGNLRFGREEVPEKNPHREWMPATNCLIMAPENKINMKGKEKHGHFVRLKDPIVLQPVIGGYLIISSWGLEASDPEVINPKHN
jgi:hypothetical protein